MPYENPITFTSEGKLLHGFTYFPHVEADETVPGVVICHPHPRAGGSMDNNVVLACCSGLRANSIAYLRFNFQGVGQSEGIAGEPDTHVADILSAMEYLRGLSNINPEATGIAGYSFGGSTTIKALLTGLNPAAAAIIACNFPQLTQIDKENLGMPKLVILGENDSFVDAQAISAMTESLEGTNEIKLIPGADHFFMRSEKLIASAIGDFFSSILRTPIR